MLMKLFIFLVFGSLCRADESYLDTLMKLFEDEVNEDAPSFASNQDETEVAYRRHRRRRLHLPHGKDIEEQKKQYGNCMLNECFKCEFEGSETRKTDGSIEDCKRQCLEDPSCKGIDVGRSNNQCYFVHNVKEFIKVNVDFQSWRKSTHCGGSAIAPDPLDYITYKDVGDGLCTHNGDYIAQMERQGQGKIKYDHVPLEILCELACSYKGDCLGYAFAERREKGSTIGSTEWVETCFVYGDWDPISSDTYSYSNMHWFGFTYMRGVVGVPNGVKTFDGLRDAKCYKKIISTPQMPSTVSSCPPGKELVKYSNGGSACEDPVNWDNAPCDKLRPNFDYEITTGYGCRGSVWSGGTTNGPKCRDNPWYRKCCTYDSDYDVCYPKVTDCHIWPKRIYSDTLAKYNWFKGPCQYAITYTGEFSENRCDGGDDRHDPSEEGQYMWFKNCCESWTEHEAYRFKQCMAKDYKKVYPRKKGQTYYWN